MSNKKKKNQNKNVNYKKIGIIAGVLALIIGLIITIGVLTKDEYYECTQYDWYEKVNSDNVLTAEQMKEAYDFYPSLPVIPSKILVKLCTYIFTKNYIKLTTFA